MKSKDQPLQKEKKIGLTIARIIALVVVIALTIYIIYIPEEQAEKLESYGFLGIFILSILTNATVIIPAPSLVVVFAMGAKFNPLMVGLAAGAGAALGELSGYLVGFSGQAVIENQRYYERLVGWLERNGPLTIAFLAFIPNPLFDLAGMVAGALRMPVIKFLLFCFLGKCLKMLLFAYAGAGILTAPWLNSLFGN